MSFATFAPRAIAAVVLLAACRWPGAATAQQQAPVPAVDTTDRAAVVNLYELYYVPYANVPDGWTGSVSAGIAGTLSTTFLSAALERINYYRAMSGLPGNITFNPLYTYECQQCALMMAAQDDLSHDPPSTWKDYTTDAAQAAANSDLILDKTSVNEGPGAVDRLIADDGDSAVTDRRWLLYPNQLTMGMGAVPYSITNPGAAAIWVMAPFGVRPTTAPVFTSWPPQGYVPVDLLYTRWSFSYPFADLIQATVAVEKNGKPMVITKELVENEIGDNTLVWEMPLNIVNTVVDETYTVQISNVLIAGVPQTFNYTVTSINPYSIPPPAAEPKVTVTATKPVAYRTGQVGKFRITRTGDLSASLAVSYKIGGTAPKGDYQHIDTTATIPAGQSGVAVKIRPVGNVPSTGDGTVVLSLLPGVSYKVGAASTATVTIEPGPKVSLTASQPVARRAGQAGKFLLARDGDLTVPLTVNYTIGGTADASDYVPIPTATVIPAGQSSVHVKVSALADPGATAAETVVLTLRPGAYRIAAQASKATVTIKDAQ